MFKLKNSSQRSKKKPPPRPPPPDLSKIRSKSTVNLVQHLSDHNDLIDLSPTNSPKVESRRPFCGSVSSSFSSSTSSIASSKKSYDYDSPTFNSNCWGTANNIVGQTNNPTSGQNSFRTTNYTSTANYTSTNTNSLTVMTNNAKANSNISNNVSNNSIVPSLFGPTIIRAAPPKVNYRQKTAKPDDLSHSPTPPMPTVPPPSPPKEDVDVITPYGVALYDFQASQPSDLSLQIDDVVILQRRVNDEWLYGQVGDREGMFPSSFVDVIVPLPGEDKVVTALYEFIPQMAGDLALVPGQKVNVIKKISDEWLYGESNGNLGQFPVTFVNRIPKFLQC